VEIKGTLKIKPPPLKTHFFAPFKNVDGLVPLVSFCGFISLQSVQLSYSPPADPIFCPFWNARLAAGRIGWVAVLC